MHFCSSVLISQVNEFTRKNLMLLPYSGRLFFCHSWKMASLNYAMWATFKGKILLPTRAIISSKSSPPISMTGLSHLREMDTPARDATLTKMFLFLLSKRVSPKGKNLVLRSKFFPSEEDSILGSFGTWKCR